MISLLLSLLLQQGAEPKLTDEQYVSESFKFYRECITKAAIKMEASDESAAIIADASVASCRGPRGIAQAFATDWLAKKNPSIDYIQARKAADSTLDEMDQNLRQDAIAAVLTRRASRKR